MEDSDRQSIVRPGAVNPKGNFWMRFVIGAIVVLAVWFFFIRPNTVELTPAEQAQLLDHICSGSYPAGEKLLVFHDVQAAPTLASR